jgi:hypothetical protein
MSIQQIVIDARKERRNAKRRKVHLMLANMRAACGSQSERLTLVPGMVLPVPTLAGMIDGRLVEITCETCRTIALKQGDSL